MNKPLQIGATNINNEGHLMTVVELLPDAKCVVEFSCEYRKEVYKSFFRNGVVRYPYHRSVHGVGFLGEGDYKTKANGKHTEIYKVWRSMLTRCYDPKTHERRPSYVGCVVTDEWHNFQIFAKWYEENHYNAEDQRMELDKDILAKGNQVYSPETCVFVPQGINALFTKNNRQRGKHPIGVSITRSGKFEAYGHKNGKRTYLGTFATPDEAFIAYKNAKESHVKDIANQYKAIIPIQLHNALMKYEVKISD